MLEFGTDGVRGHFNSSLKIEQVLMLGLAHGFQVRQAYTGSGRAKLVVGRDSRVSGDALLGAFGAGLMSQGVDLIDLGVIPTPGVAFAVRHLGAQGAAMLSASHNPVPDNGIKLFNERGKKLNDAEARSLETIIPKAHSLDLVDGISVGRRFEDRSLKDEYRKFLLSALEGQLKGQKIVLDCAYGAAAGHAEAIFTEAGAEVILLCNEVDGEKINVSCGSTDLSLLTKTVIEHGADLGFAFDGDADRCLAVSEKGEPISGDQMMVVVASELKAKGRLPGDRIVMTVMSNLGAELALKELGIQVSRTPVGDRYVLEEMERTGAVLGGEQSGHILLLDRHWSGDGMLAGLVFAGVVASRGVPVSHLLRPIKEMPQKLVNVSGVDKSKLETDSDVLQAIQRAEERLGGEGRLLVRPSGTEPLVRLMAEGPDGELIDSVLEDLKNVVLARLRI